MGARLLETLAVVTTSIYNADNRVALKESLEAGCLALGFERFTLTCHAQPGRELILDHTITTASDRFMRDYDHFNWFESDPNAQRVIAGTEPFIWDTQLDGYSDVHNKSYFDFLHSVEMCTGILIPLPHRPGKASVMGMTTSTNHSFARETPLAAKIVANAGLAKAEMLGLCSQISVDEAIAVRSLSRPQREILKWIAEGKSNSVIAGIMGLNERAVRYHVSQILQKLGVATRSQAATLVGMGKIP
ncbi:LuxR C-terminal-related transcriptional regulator [Burkholderia pseudomallei]|uniref:helix-turn-helix transcriptional regulator n=1 Tax=Burkholderia pseudomallei TaxID=28450 RepID=UPI003F65D0DA